jgi:hypothetical protein
MSKKALLSYLLLLTIAAAAFAASRSSAGLRPMDDDELTHVSGAGGISIGLDLSVYMHLGSFSYTDSDSGQALVLENVTISDGNLRPAYFATGNVDRDGDGIHSPLTFDVATVTDPDSAAFEQTMIVLRALDWLQQVHIGVETLRFCGAELGRMDIGPIHRPSFYWLLGAHDTGIDFEHGLRMSIDALRLTYNQQGAGFGFSGIHLGAYDPGAPEDPGNWRMSGLFQIGAMHEGNPATFDVGMGGDGHAAVVLNLPMNGALRIENLDWAGRNFGPMALDGIQVHRLAVHFTP